MIRSTVYLLLILGVVLVARADDPPPIQKTEAQSGKSVPGIQPGKPETRPTDDKNPVNMSKAALAMPRSWDSEIGKGYVAILKEMEGAIQAMREKGFNREEFRKISASTAEKFIGYAQKHPTDASTLDALVMAINYASSSPGSAKTLTAALDLLKKNFMNGPAICEIIPALMMIPNEATDDFVREVIKSHPKPLTRARAAQMFVDSLDGRIKLVEELGKNEAFRTNYEEMIGKEAVKKVIASVPQARKEVEEYRAKLKTEYKGLLPNLEIGEMAPETTSVSLVKLSDMKGKVVVLDFWATWCGPCRAMIPHTREFVKRLEGKPFAFVSISVDDQKETLTEFLEKEPMPWTHWWDGRKEMTGNWGVKGFPTLYVIDHKGVIRFKSVGNDPESNKKLEAIVEELVKAAEAAQK